MFVRTVAGPLTALALFAAPANAQLPPAPQPYQANDATGFRSVLPSGTRGRYSLPELAANLTTGATVPHCCDQLPMYERLVYATPGLQSQDIPKYFKDGSFGVQPGSVERTYSPRPDVTIVRDKGFGVPHIYGTTRSGAMFGLGYAGAEDRLFFMDVLRHAGRGELSSFAGGANAGQDAEQWSVAPYTEQDLERQVNDLPKYLGAQGTQIVADATNYLAGVNQYILEAKLDPAKLPGEYAAIGRLPEPFKPADIIATAAMVGGIFGKGGGEELQFSQLADALEERFGGRQGAKVFKDFRSAEDPEAPVTVPTRFPYQVPPKKAVGVARPDKGTLKLNAVSTTGSFFPTRMSNALLISAKRSASGHPLMVAGPQVGYFNPQILMEQDVHAPASPDGPGIDAQGASFVGINLYVQLGRGRDYAWSATSAGQDIIDTFALELCDDTHYRFRGKCEPIEVLTKTNRWTPTLADQTKAGSQTLTAERTKLGLVAGRGKVHGKPVIFTRLRSTYFHEVDSAAGFMDFNTPEVVKDAASFQRAASKIGYTFNWFYADADHIAYFNSGANPVRAADVDHDFPTTREWQGWNPDTWQSKVTPFEQHPQAIDQDHFVNWNNKQARAYRSADANAYSSTYRSVLLEDRLKPKMTLPELIDAMELGGSTDLRAWVDLPLALRVIGNPSDPALEDAVAKLRAWRADGGLRRDADRDGHYEHSDAIRILDQWWPLWVKAQFEPTLGAEAFKTLTETVATDNPPNNHGEHLGSAFQGSWYGYVSKDLRTTLGDPVKGRYARRYCGSRKRCRAALRASLRAALKAPDPYAGDAVCAAQKSLDPQWCFDAIRQRPTGGTSQPLIHWINRPTYQQVVEIPQRLPR
ncbi:penicillin acylase family protein [Solirubrobacter soli]|uniref:penicillin acylase family protein n=1 Tax=Solirubrobacter soli TaxID=363832 RepID=UPI000401EE28|nr:penicillin acylase family protein [Solirubrobacter soli]